MTCCYKCGATDKDLGILVRDIKNLSAGYDMCCEDCKPKIREETNEHGTACFPARKMTVEELENLPNMLNPDIGCDFCDAYDPQWLYDLDI